MEIRKKETQKNNEKSPINHYSEVCITNIASSSLTKPEKLNLFESIAKLFEKVTTSLEILGKTPNSNVAIVALIVTFLAFLAFLALLMP